MFSLQNVELSTFLLKPLTSILRHCLCVCFSAWRCNLKEEILAVFQYVNFVCADNGLIDQINIWAATWQNQQNECAPRGDSDQPGHMPSLITVFAVRMKKPWILSYPLSPWIYTYQSAKQNICLQNHYAERLILFLETSTLFSWFWRQSEQRYVCFAKQNIFTVILNIKANQTHLWRNTKPVQIITAQLYKDTCTFCSLRSG